MTFLEALIWMSQSEENVAMRVPKNGEIAVNYRIKRDRLWCLKSDWELSEDTFLNLSKNDWAKVKPSPEEVEVVAFCCQDGELRFVEKDSSEMNDMLSNEYWRKVKVRFT